MKYFRIVILFLVLLSHSGYSQELDTIWVTSFSDIDTTQILNEMNQNSDLHFSELKFQYVNPKTLKVFGVHLNLMTAEEVWRDVGYIQELKEPWDLGCENSSNSIEMISCSYRSFEISDSILKTLHNEVLLDLQNDSERMKGMIEGPNDSTYIKYYETTVKIAEEYKKSMELFYEYRDRMINVMTLQYNEGRMVGYYESSFGTQINVKQIEILRLLKGE
jgi:hypothetical protein